MSDKVLTEKEVHNNKLLKMPVNPDSKLKQYIVDYVGEKTDCEEVTVNLIAEVMAVDFPEFIYSFAEENYILGYNQGLDDARLLKTSTWKKD